MKQITILNNNMTYHLLIDDKSVWLNMAELVTLKNTIETAIQSGFKEGDFLLFEGDYDLVTIFAAYTSDGSWHEHASISLGSMELQTGLHITAYDCEGYKVRQASDEEKKILLDALDEHGYAWNPETLEIEKKPAFEVGKLYVFDEQDEDGDVTVIGELIGKDESTLTFGIQYEIETEKFVTDQTFDLNISLHKELREATENEVDLFYKHYSIWKEKEKKAMSKCSFKPFDKVLVRGGSGIGYQRSSSVTVERAMGLESTPCLSTADKQGASPAASHSRAMSTSPSLTKNTSKTFHSRTYGE